MFAGVWLVLLCLLWSIGPVFQTLPALLSFFIFRLCDSHGVVVSACPGDYLFFDHTELLFRQLRLLDAFGGAERIHVLGLDWDLVENNLRYVFTYLRLHCTLI